MTGEGQGCIISPLLFLLTIDFVMYEATSDPQHGIPGTPDVLLIWISQMI